MKQHLGSTISLILGSLMLSAGITQPEAFSTAIGGLIMISGALAYRSAKKRRLQQVISSYWRIACEVLAMLLIIFLVFGQRDHVTHIINEPVPFLIIPLWAINAYIVALLNPKFKPAPPSA